MKNAIKLFLFSLILCCANSAQEWEEFFKWKQMEYDHLPETVTVFDAEPPVSEIEHLGLYSKTSYIPYNNLPVGVAHYKNRLFITVPRRRVGVPSTLNVINFDNVDANEKSPKLTAYPSYAINDIPENLHPNPDRIISIYRARIDDCGRLWFIDTGYLEYPNHKVQVQRPSIWAIDLETNERVLRHDIPESIAELGDGFVSITVDVQKDSCDHAYAYIPNMRTNTIAVYSMHDDRFWTVRHNTFQIEPRQGDFNFNGIGFQWSDGIFSIALGPHQENGHRLAYYHAMASLSEYAVSTEILKSETLATRSYHGEDFKFIGQRQPHTQSAMHDLDTSSNIMIHSEISKNGVGCWNANRSFMGQGVIAQSNETMIYPSDLKVDQESTIWFITDRIPIYIYGRLDSTEYNYRVFKKSVADAIQGTRCAGGSSSGGLGNRFGGSDRKPVHTHSYGYHHHSNRGGY